MSYTHNSEVSPASRHAELPPRVELECIAQTLAWQARPLVFLRECAQRYGDAFTLNLGTHGLYAVFSDPKAIREIFTAGNDVLHAGRGNRILKPLLGSQSLLLLEGQRHIRERRLLLPGLHGQAIDRYADAIQRAALDVMADADAAQTDPSLPRALQPLMQAISMRVILHAIFSIHGGRRFEELSAHLSRVLNDAKLSLGLLDQLDRDFSNSAWQTFRNSLTRIDELLLQEIDLRRSIGRSDQGDLLDTLLATTSEDGMKLEDQALRDQLMTLIVTGYETTGTALAWAFYWLAHQPVVLNRLRSELAFLGRTPAPMHLAQVKYLHAVCQETLRIQPIIPIVAREAQRPLSVQRYWIPAGVTVVACIYLAHHRSAAFPSPESFRPERFLEASPDPWEYLPFGGGVRRCIGMSLALFEMKIVLGSILVNYEFGPLVQELRPVRRFVTLAPEGGMALRIRRIHSEQEVQAPTIEGTPQAT